MVVKENLSKAKLNYRIFLFPDLPVLGNGFGLLESPTEPREMSTSSRQQSTRPGSAIKSARPRTGKWLYKYHGKVGLCMRFGLFALSFFLSSICTLIFYELIEIKRRALKYIFAPK